MNDIKRGYPNPDYTEEDIFTEEELEELGMVYVDLDRYEELVSKAAALDILTADIKSKIDAGIRNYDIVNDSLVMAVTGMSSYKLQLEAKKETEAKADGKN